MPTEPIPIDAIMSEFNSQWNAGNVTKPSLITVNAAGQPLRFDLNIGDHLIGRTGSPAFEEEPIGNWKYGNRTYNIEIELFTLNGRQRLYDLMREIRRVVHANKHGMTNYQRWQVTSFVEPVVATANVWTGTMTILLENNAILLET